MNASILNDPDRKALALLFAAREPES